MVDFKLGSQDKALQLSGQSRGFISPRSQVQIPPEPSTPFLEIRVLLQNFLIFQKEKWLSGRKQQIANLSYNLLYPGFESLFLLNRRLKKYIDILKISINIIVRNLWDCSSIGQSTALSRRKLRVRVSSVPIF